MSQPTKTNELNEEDRFFNNLTVLVNTAHSCLLEIKKVRPKCMDDAYIAFLRGLLHQLEHIFIIENFIISSHMYWDNINKKEESFFIENASKIFGNVPVEQLNVFKTILTEKEHGERIIKDIEVQKMWRLLHGMVKISIKYYTKHKMCVPDMDIEHHKIIWNIMNLE